MNKILILFAHPRFEQSRSNKALVSNIPKDPNITFHDLYETYPDFNIDIEYEQQLLLEHNIIIWHHPLYWYSAPPLLKQWIDMVLEFGWAYGPDGNALHDKLIFNVLTSGGTKEAYQKQGRNRYTIRELLAPYEQTSLLCWMIYLPPFTVQGTHKLNQDQLTSYANDYNYMLKLLLNEDFSMVKMNQFETLNDWVTMRKNNPA